MLDQVSVVHNRGFDAFGRRALRFHAHRCHSGLGRNYQQFCFWVLPNPVFRDQLRIDFVRCRVFILRDLLRIWICEVQHGRHTNRSE